LHTAMDEHLLDVRRIMRALDNQRHAGQIHTG
jgi:hypothetical protein